MRAIDLGDLCPELAQKLDCLIEALLNACLIALTAQLLDQADFESANVGLAGGGDNLGDW